MFLTCLQEFVDNYYFCFCFSFSQLEESADRPPMKIKDEVYAKHKNGRFYLGEVTDITEQLYYCVLFDDNSISNDLYPTDVTVRVSS